jgi:hypothetical protein
LFPSHDLFFAGTDSSATLTVPSGFTAITQDNAGAFMCHIFAKVAAGTEGGTSPTGTLSGTESSCYVAYAIQDWSGDISDVEASTIATAVSTDQADPSSVTASWGSDDNLFIAAAIADYWNQTATAWPAGYTGNQTTQQHQDEFSGTQGVSVATRELASATDDPSAFTLATTSNQTNAAYTVVVKPASGPAGPSLDTAPSTAYHGQSRTVSGSGFGATQGTGGLTIGGVSQTITSWSDTSITFTTVLGTNSYGTGKTIEVTTDDAGTDSGTVELVADTTNGFGFATMSSPNTTDESSVAYNTTPTVVTGDQFEWEDFNALGNLVIDAEGFVSSVDTEGTFRGRFWDASDGTWGSVNTFTASATDETAPTISSVDVPAAGSHKAGDDLEFTVNWDESVDVTGTPQLAINIGGTTRQADYVSGDGTTALAFTYTVQAGDNDADGISVTSLGLNGGTIQDAATNNADLTLNNVGDTSAVLVDTVKPVITVTGQNPYTLVVGETYTDPGATASDDQDGSLGSVTGTGSVDDETIGQYTITYPGAGVVDTAGNVADDATRTVNVVAAPDPDEWPFGKGIKPAATQNWTWGGRHPSTGMRVRIFK